MNAEQNPFRSSRIEALPFRFVHGSLDGVLAAFERHGRRGAIVGPPGSGKTTLLREIARRLRADGSAIVWLDPRSSVGGLRDLARPCESTFVVVDGFERTPPVRRLFVRLAARRSGMLVTSHAECGLPVIHRCRTSERLALELLSDVWPDPDEALRGRMLERFAARGGDVRAAFHDLYVDAETGVPRDFESALSPRGVSAVVT